MDKQGSTIGKTLRELSKPGGVYLVLALINVRLKILYTPQWLDGSLERIHGLCMAFRSINHDQSRVLQFWIPELLVKIFDVSVPDAYMLQRWIFVFLAFCCFHLYLRAWFDRIGAFSGVVFLAAIMPLTYANNLQESASLLMLLFILILWAIRERRTKAYMILLFVGAMANETVLILPAVYFAWNLRKPATVHAMGVFGRTLLTSLPAFAITAVIRYVTREAGGYSGDTYWLPFNLEGIGRALISSPVLYWQAPYLGIFLIYGVFWGFAFWRFSRKPPFLRRASLIIPVFIAIHLVTGRIEEIRQMIPLSFLIVPMAMCTLTDESGPSDPPGP